MGGKYYSLLAILSLNLFTIVALGMRINYLAELLIFVLMGISSLIILRSVYKNEREGVFTSLFFIIALINMFYIRNAFYSDPLVNAGILGRLLFGVTLLSDTFGFFIGIASMEKRISNKGKDKIIEKEIEPKLRAMEQKLNNEMIQDSKVEPWQSVVEQFYPGKFIASSNSDYYHSPKCDWAKKIVQSRRVWFQSKEEAKKKGYKMHSCLK